MNAADFYQQAFAFLPESDLQAYHPYVNTDNPEAARLVEQGREALDMLDRAVRCKTCDWGGAEDVLPLPSDRISRARCLAVLAMLRAEASFRRGDDRAGLDDLIAITILGRHIGQGIYVSGLSGMAIEQLAVSKALEIVDRLDSETRRAFGAQLGSLPAFPNLASALRAEQRYFRRVYRDKFAAIADKDVVRTVREEFGAPAVTDENSGSHESISPAGDPVRRILVAAGGTRAGLLVLADAALAAMDTLAGIANGSEPSPTETLAGLREEASSNHLMAEALRSFDMMSPIWDRHRERFERLRARASGG